MELSKRLQAVAELVSDGMTVTDVGTDHAYIPIYLIKAGKSHRAFAMDINEGPLLRAKTHITEQGLSHLIETRLSDGVDKMLPGECDCVVIAGMGGALTIHILEEGKDVFRSLKEFVLQPQSEIQKVRQYLCENEYCIIEENMVFEDGKFYPMMKVLNRKSCAYTNVELRFGKLLLEQKHPVLKMFLEKEAHKKEMILENLNKKSGLHIEIRMKEIQEKLEEIKYALQRYYS